MKKISFNGKDYVRASEVAKKFRYTQDYVGQLCRSKKVDARLVGRNWYVDVDSVVDYRKTKHKTQKDTAAKTSSNAAAKSKHSTGYKRRASKLVEPVLRTKTAKVVRRRSHSKSAIAATYSSDDGVLIPVLNQGRDQAKDKKRSAQKNDPVKRKNVRIEKRPAVTVSVASDSKSTTKFRTDKLPEISLSGKLSVEESLDQRTDYDHGSEQEREDVAVEITEPQKATEVDLDLNTQDGVRTDGGAGNNFAPAAITESARVEQSGSWFVLGAVFAALILSGLLFSLESIVSTDYDGWLNLGMSTDWVTSLLNLSI